MHRGTRPSANDYRMRRLRIVSDIMEDYQENVRTALSIVEQDLNNVEETTPRTRFSTPSYTANAYTANRNFATQDRVNYFNYINNNRWNDRRPRGFNDEEIEMATVEYAFDASSVETQCPITLEYFQPGQEVLRVNGCGHAFSKPAIVEWFGRHRECPVCRGMPILRRRTVPPDSNVVNLAASFLLDDNVPSAETESAVNSLISTLVSGFAGALNGATPSLYEREFTLNLGDIFLDASGGFLDLSGNQ